MCMCVVPGPVEQPVMAVWDLYIILALIQYAAAMTGVACAQHDRSAGSM